MKKYFQQLMPVFLDFRNYFETPRLCFAVLQDFIFGEREKNLLFCSLSFEEGIKTACQAKDHSSLSRICLELLSSYDIVFVRHTCLFWAEVFYWEELKKPLHGALEAGYEKPVLGFIYEGIVDVASDISGKLPIVRFGKNVPSHLMAYVPEGSFFMGVDEGSALAMFGSSPRHRAHITRPFWMALFPCAQMLGSAVLREHNNTFTDQYKPMESISWIDVIYFCNELSRKEGLKPVYSLPEHLCNNLENNTKLQWDREANGYRLPTEAEWEYCAKAGREFLYSGGNSLDEVGWFSSNTYSRTSMVGEKKPNEWGFYDMSGNVFEWVWDASFREYSEMEVYDPIYVRNEQGFRICRGGSWDSEVFSCTTFFRNHIRADVGNGTIGFRLARNA